MGIPFKYFNLPLGGLGLSVAVLFTPDLLGKLLSTDGVLNPQTVEEVQVWRLLLGLVSFPILLITLIWFMNRNQF